MTHMTVRLLLGLVAAGALGGCLSPSYPINPPSASAAAPRAAVVAAPAVADAPVVTTAEGAPIAAPARAVVESHTLHALAPAPSPQAVAPPAVPAADIERPRSERTVVTRSVTGKVVSVEVPGRGYKVRKGDTLEKIAGKLDSDIGELARDNHLKKPYRLKPGQVLAGPSASGKAYVVGDGDTLFAIARRFNVSVDALRSENGLGTAK